LSGANSTPPRTEVVLGDDTDDGNDGETLVAGVIRADGYKLLVGQLVNGFWTGPLSPNGTACQPGLLDCGNTSTPLCLFNIFLDPNEHDNVASLHPDIAAELAARIVELQKTVFSPLRGPSLADQACANSNATWGGFVGPFLA
jgi:hypothetical protein